MSVDWLRLRTVLCGLSLCMAVLFASLTSAHGGTVVTFHTSLGDMDVELYDQEKPVTTANFLQYIANGLYNTNMFLHRCIPGFVVQGGGFGESDRNSSSVMSKYLNIPTFPAITNEFSVGQKISNTYGTIAMAKTADPNSATSQWFFNLANNSASLDNTNNSGGFTVFGHVTSGTNVLNQFNTFKKAGYYIVDLTYWYGTGAGLFSDLPVNYSGATLPKYSDLFYVDITVKSYATNHAPVLAELQDVSIQENQTLTLQATATDADIPAQQLVFSLQSAPEGMTIDSATGLIRWTPSEAQGPSTNRFIVTVTDNGQPVRSAQRVVQVIVQEVNTAPVMSAIDNQTAAPGKLVSIELKATDSDIPANQLSYSIVQGPSGGVINSNRFEWTPLEGLGSRTESVTIRVNDDGTPSLSATQSFTIQVGAEAPVITLIAPVTGITSDERFELRGRVTDNVGVNRAWWLWNGKAQGDLTLSNQQFLISNCRLASGTNQIEVRARDAAGNEAVAAVQPAWTPLRSFAVVSPLAQMEGKKIEVPLTLASQGEVRGASFVLHYDPEYLKDPVFTWAFPASSYTNQINTKTPGEVRVAFSMSSGTLPKGTQTVAAVTFRSRSVPTNTVTPLSLEMASVSDSQGTNFVFGTEVQNGQAQILSRTICGDNNANLRLDIGDAALIQRLNMQLDPPRSWDITGNDLNEDGSLNSLDVTKALRIVAGIDPQPRALGPLKTTLSNPNILQSQNTSAELALIVPNEISGQTGDVVTINVVLTNLVTQISGATFVLDYPTNALRLVNAQSYQAGSFVPANAVAVWNLPPGQTDYLAQTGRVVLAASSPTVWPGTNGILAVLSFQVQATATAQPLWPLKTSNIEITPDGYDNRQLPDATGVFSSKGGTPIVAPTLMSTGLKFSSNGFSITLDGQAGVEYVLEASTNLNLWTPVRTNYGTGGPLELRDSATGGYRYRFYRAKAR